MPKDEVTVMYIDPKVLSKEDKKLAEENDLSTQEILLLPRTFKKRFVACTIAMQQLVDASNMGERLEIDEELTCELKRLLSSVVYLTNSTSFRKGLEYYDFDKMEIDRKLGRR